MQIKVNAHTIELNKTIDVNSGEYNINICEFTFSNEYEGLTKMAIFSNEESSYQVIITNNVCIIPSEILQSDGTIGLGVYAYEVDGDNLIKRYSPHPVFFNVELGSYQLANEITPPSPSVVEQILQELETLSDSVSVINGQIQTINETIPTLALKSEIPTKVSQLQNDSGFINKNVDDLTNYTKASDLSPVATSGAYSDLSGTPDLSVYATNQALNSEISNRENADIGLQGQIDAITSSSDVKDIVGTYQDLQNYDTQHLGNNDVIKVLQDSTHNNAMTYYRWLKDTSTWQYIGQEGPYYTKSEIDTTLQGYVEDSDLADYVKNTDYASSNKGGVIKANVNGFLLGSTGNPYVSTYTNEQYNNLNNNYFIGKGTLENVLNARIGDISNAIDLINGESI